MHTSYAHHVFRCAVLVARAPATTKSKTIRRSPHQLPALLSQSRRFFAASPAMTTHTPRFSAGVDEPALARELEPLLASAGLGGRWALIPGGEGLERTFSFKTFAKTWDFMTAVSLQCKLKNHHPEWSNVRRTSLHSL
ncbi:uncharacterized protein GGS25DRAFT_470659 [Hypoxylon fragiforme]|uniref:uncharacterized protein n=1 Tax=Hypoxylon fragiforme TaxID=63214 RepID=UPI0020C5E198|nr:uncharacterized protein GGS25DRAFT_470659 [Hypoxylon fragiforme]KAI2614185.1 hypothetical protein GGS25DRAFT_470659 [Hypoxylon fragiforme]